MELSVPETYKEQIARLLRQTPFSIDQELKVSGRPPTMASSEFLTNKEQGDWAEQVVLNAINKNSDEYVAVQYGRSDSLAAGDEGFEKFYMQYQEELNTIGKRPDLLIFRKSEIGSPANIDIDDEDLVGRALAAIEVRSSSFLAQRYALFTEERFNRATSECCRIQSEILLEPYSALLAEKSPEIHQLLRTATPATFRELDFRFRSWSSSLDLQHLSDLLKRLKEQIKILHKRENLGITPKLEDLVLVNRWIQRFNVRHYYLQVFFDKAYVIPFKEILQISSDPSKEDLVFFVERDVKNQGKTTIKINIQVGKEVLGRIDMPEHRSAMKELDRGRLLFYVTFEGGKGYLDKEVFEKAIIHEI
jgi:type II restriction enzyme